MSTTDTTSLVIAVVAILVAVVTATFQIFEMRRQTKRTEAQLAAIADDALERSLRHLSRTFLMHPELRPIFQPSEFAPSPTIGSMSRETRLRAETVCDDLMDTFERAYRNAGDPLYPWKGELWAYFDQLMQGSDFLFDYLIEHEDWWKPKLLERALKSRPEFAISRLGSDNSLIRVMRHRQFFNRFRLLKINLDDCFIGELRSGHCLEASVPAGEHTIEVVGDSQRIRGTALEVRTLPAELFLVDCKSRRSPAVLTDGTTRVVRGRATVVIDINVPNLDLTL